jgi:hypothetical protein
MTFSTRRAKLRRSRPATSRSHFNAQTSVPDGPIAPRPNGRPMHWPVLWVAVVASMLWPASMRAQYTESVLYSFCQQGGCVRMGTNPNKQLRFSIPRVISTVLSFMVGQTTGVRYMSCPHRPAAVDHGRRLCSTAFVSCPVVPTDSGPLRV